MSTTIYEPSLAHKLHTLHPKGGKPVKTKENHLFIKQLGTNAFSTKRNNI